MLTQFYTATEFLLKKPTTTSKELFHLAMSSKGIERENLLKQVLELNATYSGTGTELKKLISWVIPKSDNCDTCQDHIQIMNRWGPETCKKNIDIIVGWLRESARIRGLPFFKTIALYLINKAIKKCSNVPSSLTYHSDKIDSNLSEIKYPTLPLFQK